MKCRQLRTRYEFQSSTPEKVKVYEGHTQFILRSEGAKASHQMLDTFHKTGKQPRAIPAESLKICLFQIRNGFLSNKVGKSLRCRFDRRTYR